MPVAPHLPSVVITLRALEVFRVAHLRCPRLGIQAFVRTLCDMHGVPPRPYLAYQFTIAFDLYLGMRAIVDKHVQVTLGRDTPNWRIKNTCPACMYKLEGEEPLDIPLLFTMDGNNSLKRFMRREREQVSEDGTTAPGASKERKDNRVPPGDYYLSREVVDKWGKEGLDELMKGFVASEGEEEEMDDGCDERWQNMKEDVTARAWGLYDETGFFPALCRHGFVLVACDMVKSGELSKYGYVITDHLIRIFGALGLGYDIGCKFAKMVRAHPVLSKLAKDNSFKSLVGAFHGYGHKRRCQVDHLATYVKGVGSEDLEGCEKFFSKSNALAPSTRYATVFHRQQTISPYLKHADTFDAYQGLCKCSFKYCRALDVKKTEPVLQETMRTLGVATRDVFETWLAREKECLQTLSREPLEETLQMEYYQKLVNLADHDQTRRLETQRRHALELRAKTLAVVQDLELRLGTEARWVRDDANWVATTEMVSKRRFQRALDHLEGLVIARMFELTKVNMAGTGYKLRKHIAKALQVRSKSVKAAIIKYNEAADASTPSRPNLTWEQVVEYAFLADFDILRLGRQDIRDEPWAQPAGRAAMDQHYKLLRADEEIKRLNLEIPRFVTFMVDEEAFLVHHERRLREEGDAALAYQVQLHRMERARFNALHMSRLVKLSKVPGFTASIVPATPTIRGDEGDDVEMHAEPAAPPFSAPARTSYGPMRAVPGSDEDSDDEEGAEDDDAADEEASESFAQIMRISYDVGEDDAASKLNSLTLY
ncbi:hypothetical protein DFH09DRAFT_1251024 [Mycena vulgaris]|nr:hypothetical protein DFH09DRAFT_1251024 [Mycena vulgaris]